MAERERGGVISVGKRLTRIEERLDNLDERISKLDAKINYIFGAFAAISIALTIVDILRRTP